MLDAEFGFTLDVCALPSSAKCAKYFTPDDDGLKRHWHNDRFWMNPPYGRGQNVYVWVEKAFCAAKAGGTGVCLLPASVDTKWFHQYCLQAQEIRFVRDRLWFSLNGITQRSNHGSMIVVFRPQVMRGTPKISSISNCRVKNSDKSCRK